MKKPLTSDFLYINFLIHPLPLAAVTITFINDHWLKYLFPGFLTGKISDFAGLFYFPVLLSALGLIKQLPRSQKPPILSRTNIILSTGLTGLVFVLIKTSMTAQNIYLQIYESIGIKAQVTTDSTDLIALISLLFSYAFLKRYSTHP